MVKDKQFEEMTEMMLEELAAEREMTAGVIDRAQRERVLAVNTIARIATRDTDDPVKLARETMRELVESAMGSEVRKITPEDHARIVALLLAAVGKPSDLLREEYADGHG